MSYARGNFSFLPAKLSHEKQMLEDAFAAMEKVEGSWDYLANKTVPEKDTGFMFSRDTMIKKISDEVDKDGKIGHSGSSFGWTMREMEYIAKNGWTVYVHIRLAKIKLGEQEEKERKAAEAKPRYFNDPFFDEARKIPHFKAQIEEAENLAASQGGNLSYAQMRNIMG
jgi:hypothetical protein